jgi:uncharacterized protein YndB with AHSA1/START domain
MASVAETTPVRKTIHVKTSVERAFQVFTDGFDSWWPRSHKLFTDAELDKAIIEGRVGGRCYQRASDGRECEWGKVTVWEPPRRVVVAWQLDGQWQYDPDLAHASEVEVTFTPEADGTVRVDLEHRHFARHGASGAMVQTGVGGEGGWASLLGLFKTGVERTNG